MYSHFYTLQGHIFKKFSMCIYIYIKGKNMVCKNKQRNSCHKIQKPHPQIIHAKGWTSGPPMSILQK